MSARFGDQRLPERFWNKVEPEPNTGCWLWSGADNGKGYGNFGWQRRVATAHLVTWRVLVGTIPQGLEIDHKCRVKCCVNPDHLEAVTHTENIRRSVPYLKVNSKSSCLRGHPYVRTRVRPNGRSYRYCWDCQVQLQRERRGRKTNEQRATYQAV